VKEKEIKILNIHVTYGRLCRCDRNRILFMLQ